jgi:hypothetical protein
MKVATNRRPLKTRMTLTEFGWKLCGTAILLAIPSGIGVASVALTGGSHVYIYIIVWIFFFSCWSIPLGIVIAIAGYGVNWWRLKRGQSKIQKGPV